MTPNRARALGRQRYPSGLRTRRFHAAVPATSGPPQTAPGGRAYQTHRTHGRKISCIRLYLSLGAVRGRAASRCDPLRLIPRLGRICVCVHIRLNLFILFLVQSASLGGVPRLAVFFPLALCCHPGWCLLQKGSSARSYSHKALSEGFHSQRRGPRMTGVVAERESVEGDRGRGAPSFFAGCESSKFSKCSWFDISIY